MILSHHFDTYKESPPTGVKGVTFQALGAGQLPYQSLATLGKPLNHGIDANEVGQNISVDIC